MPNYKYKKSLRATSHSGFRDRMPELEAALRKPGQERMTVLPEAIDARMTLDKEGKISYSFTSLCQMLLFDMLSARQQGSSVLMCPLCSKVFAAGRSDVVYCPECRPTGARTAHTNSMRSDALLTVYAKARQRVYTAKSRGTLDAEQSKLLLSQMKDTLDRARLSGADAEAFAEQLSRITAKKVTNCY